MTTITVTKGETGKLRGFTAKDQKAYSRFKAYIERLDYGEIFTLDFWFPRNRKLHGRHFAMLAQIFEAQEAFQDPDQMRMWLQMGAGHCEFVPSPRGEGLVAIPKSIAWRSMDDVEFGEHHEKVKDFLREPRARAFLWPHLTEEQTWQTVEIILADFETHAQRATRRKRK